jgi:hypothetical protein
MAQDDIAAKKSKLSRIMHWVLRIVVAAVITQIVTLYVQIPYLSAVASWVWSSIQELFGWLSQDAALSRLSVLVAALIGCALAAVVIWLWRKLATSEAKSVEREMPQPLPLDADQLAVLRVIGMYVEQNSYLPFNSILSKTGLSRIAARVSIDALKAHGLIPDQRWSDDLSSLTASGRNYIMQAGLLTPSQT